MIIGAAITVAFYKLKKKFGEKKKPANTQNNTNPSQHNCADCSAECILRNSIKPTEASDNYLCKKTEITKV